MHELQIMYAIERVLSTDRPTQLSDIPDELRPIDHTPNNTRFDEICRLEGIFAARFIVEETTRDFKLTGGCSDTKEGMTIKEEFRTRIRRLHCMGN